MSLCQSEQVAAKLLCNMAMLTGRENDFASRPDPDTWVQLIKMADHAKLLPLLVESMRDDQPEILHADNLAFLHEYLISHRRRVGKILDRCAWVLSHLQSAGVDPLLFKGPFLSEIAYGSAARRDFNDLDIIVRESEVMQALAILVQLGFRIEDAGPTWVVLAAGTEDQQLCLDLHLKLMPMHLPNISDMDGLWLRSQPLQIGDRKFITLSFEDTILVAAMHLVKEYHNRAPFLGYLIDFSTLLRKIPRGERGKLFDHCVANGAWTYYKLAVCLSEDLLSVDWAAVPDASRAKDRHVDTVVADMLTRLGSSELPGAWGIRAYSLHALKVRNVLSANCRDWLKREFRSVLSRVFYVTPQDERWCPMPKRLRWLYLFLRPVRQIVVQTQNLLS